MITDYTEDDRLAVLTACSTIGMERSSDVEPLGPVTWSNVAIWLNERGERPAALLEPGLDFDEFKAGVARTLSTVPARASSAALELESLEHIGIWNMVRFDAAFPQQLWQRLKGAAPPVLFGIGDKGLLSKPGIAIVGSRDITPELAEVARALGERIASAGRIVISGGARGVDRCGMDGSLDRGGVAVGLLSGDLAKLARQSEIRRLVEDERLALAVHVHPRTGFSAGNAMARNKYIHALAEAAIVVSTSEKKGGTWQGAVENLNNGWSPLLVWMGEGAPPANQKLVDAGGYPIETMPADGDELLAQVASADNAPLPAGKPQPEESRPTLFNVSDL